MKKINSRQKGARGERQWRDELRANGYEARRGQQFSGSPDSPDVVCPSLPWIHWEVKCVEHLNLYAAMDQARHDRGLGKVPIVAHRRNFWAWLVTLEADTLFGEENGFLSGTCFFARTESRRLNVHEAMAQAGRDASGRTAFLLHRRQAVPAHNEKATPWLVTMAAETFFRMLRGNVAGVTCSFSQAHPNSGPHKKISSLCPSHGATGEKQTSKESELVK